MPARRQRPQVRHLLAVALNATLLTAVTACEREPGSMPMETASAPLTAAATPSQSLVAALPGTLAADFADLQPVLGGHVGLAIMPVGGDQMAVLGDLTTGPAWSTIKVPLMLAVLRANGTTSQMSAAITESDNAAADVLWQSLGKPDMAAESVTSILREGSDSVTMVPATRSRSDYSPYGQTDWSLPNQLRFAAALPCLPGATTVLALMAKITASQQWGLGRLDNSVFKGGWGPDANGNYLVRQFGLVTTQAGQIAIAVAAQSNSGTYEGGTAVLNKLADLVGKHLGELMGGSCQKAPSETTTG